jgi:hypothetical protein
LKWRCRDRSISCSLDEITTALEDWINTWKVRARPFEWAKVADQTIGGVTRRPDHDHNLLARTVGTSRQAA